MPTLTSTTPAVQTGRTRRSGSASAGAEASDMLMAPPGTDDLALKGIRISAEPDYRGEGFPAGNVGFSGMKPPAIRFEQPGESVNASAVNTADLYDERAAEL